jgi:peptidoglycan-N-acetylglucosamine deacetylase
MMQPLDAPVHALSFDIEDWFHIVDVPALADPRRWPELPSIVERRSRQILAILSEHRARATFFVLGWIADRYPALVREIAAAGHELGTHSYWHRKVYALDESTFRGDLQQSIEAIERASGVRVRCFRAPSFSITHGCEWALDVLHELGMDYDASLFPARRAHGGYRCQPGPHWLTTPRGRRLAELPMSVVRLGPWRMCYSGGGYLRLLPLPLITRFVGAVARQNRPTVVYLHPRDFADDCPVVPMAAHRRFKCYVGLSRTEAKLRALLSRFRFDSCRQVLATCLDDFGSTHTRAA